MNTMKVNGESSQMDGDVQVIDEVEFLQGLEMAEARRATVSATAGDDTGGADPSPPASVDSMLDLSRPVIDLDQNGNGLKFLLQKELKNSDVGSLGRIVLPKREAETYLPPLAVREGISLVMEDTDIMQMWTFKYRFWPNNKSRMYILENAGNFIKAHGLQPGDTVVIYKNEEKNSFVIQAKKEIHQEPPPDTDYDGIFDNIVPEISPPSVRYSELFQPLTVEANPGFDLNYAFSADISMGYQDESVNASTAYHIPGRDYCENFLLDDL
ncbi:hypothetical protein J5N97_003877 [Dioscorea zingiberensis]|uniref:TF-B3 domain-containing protein n=1 Tax=Dioscorea zingiberensis TaxID=325984 RepID=A0A9D5D530_9LILI|nr:hypothetical protein J5N97_003877 [Dioscorea zingiberensis]